VTGRCAQLHVYRLDGRLDPLTAVADVRFLGDWPEAETSCLFFSSPADEAVEALLRSHPHLRLAERTSLPYEQWQGAIAAEERIGPFRIVPAWEPAARQAVLDPLALVLDPGIVFGAGNHPTTRDCLLAIDRAAAEARFETVLDLGTGTGILALAAARRLGARVAAVDLSPAAVRTAAGNVARNGLAGRVLVALGRAEDAAGGRCDLVIANLQAPVLHRVMDSPGFGVARGAILSGVMAGEAEGVRRRLEALGVPIRREWATDGVWRTFLAVR
jgi:ribosomal protein L11 methyltransferase